jgi:hypothetical protein
MFVLLVVPIGGGLLAGLLIRSLRTALVVTGILWLIGSAVLVGERAADPVYELNVRIWIGVAVGLLGFIFAWAGHRIRTRGRAQSSDVAG